MGFNSVDMGFPQRSCAAKPMLEFSSVCKGEYVAIAALSI